VDKGGRVSERERDTNRGRRRWGGGGRGIDGGRMGVGVLDGKRGVVAET
jgi:hypothetical protein